MSMSAISRPDLTLRQRMIMVIEYFVQQARSLEGIQRAAVIGSIATPKREPKDLDLLVWIDDRLDLTELAALGRRVRGRLLQAGNRGCDIFLADARDTYLGRLCRWRTCERGVRQACLAQHCGRRKFLYDDLRVLNLPTTVLRDPPLDLLPELIVHKPLPDDLLAYARSQQSARTGTDAPARTSPGTS